MKKNIFLWLMAAVVLTTSCKKDADSGADNSSASSLFGEWKYKGMKMKSTTDVTIVMDATTMGYIVGLNYACDASASGGTYTFANDKITATNVFYTPTGTVTMKMSQNGAVVLNETLPLTSGKITTNGSSDWKAIGSDSIYCPGGAILKVEDPANGMAGDVSTIPSGYKYKISGNKLTLYFRVKGTVKVPSVQGMTIKNYNADWDAEVWMEK